MTDLDHPAPDFPLDQAAALAHGHFGLVGEFSPLASERDQNFRLVSSAGEWTFKIVNASEPVLESEFQAALLDHLAAVAPELALPRLRRTVSGRTLATTDRISGARHALRMVSWLPGKPLAESERTPEVLNSLGRMIGRMDRALQGFIHPGALRVLDWDVRHAGLSRSRLHHVADAADRALVSRFLDRCDSHVAPRLPALRAQVIHNDANDWNVLVDPHRPDTVAGLIDFGDALHTVLIAEVAVACAYAILDRDDPIGAAAGIAAGFHAEYPLHEEEVDLLFDLIAARLVISVTLSAQRKDRTGDNPYLAISEAPGWRLLRRLDAMDPRFATAILRHACGFDAAPGASAISGWITRNAKTFAPIVKPHPATLAKALVPYGDAANPMTVASAAAEPKKASAWWDAYATEHDVTLGIGPWGEARTVYCGDMFCSRLIEGERRDRHLGLDLFMPAGTKLYTPLAATVKSVEIEEDPLGYGGLVALLHEPEGCPPFVTLWGHLAHEVISLLKPGDQLEAGALVAEMGANTENGGWAPHLHLQISTDPDMAARATLGVGEGRGRLGHARFDHQV